MAAAAGEFLPFPECFIARQSSGVTSNESWWTAEAEWKRAATRGVSAAWKWPPACRKRKLKYRHRVYRLQAEATARRRARA